MSAFDELEALDVELARRLAECEGHLRAVVSDYRALTQTALFRAFDPDLRSQIATAVRSYVSHRSERLQAAKAGIEAIRSLDSVRAMPADPLAGLAPSDGGDLPAAASRLQEPQGRSRRAPETTLSIEPIEPIESDEFANGGRETPEIASMVVSRLREPQGQSRRAPETLPIESDEPVDGGQGTPEQGASETTPALPPSTAQALVGASEGRPKPRPPRGSAAPVRGDGLRRSDAHEQPAAPERTMRTAVRRHKSGADIRSVSREEVLTGMRPEIADSGDDGGVMSPNRPLSPEAIFDATARRLKDQQRRNIAAKNETEAAKSANIVLREAEMVDDLGNTVGRASAVLKEGNLFTAEQIEVFLDSLEDGRDQSAEDPAAVLRTILKARSAFQFQGPDGGPALRAMISYANACAFAEDDAGVLVLQGVGLARR